MSDYKVTNLVGTPTDYSDKNNWVHITENPDKEEDKMLRYGVMEQFKDAPSLFKEVTNLYEPYYRQSNLCALLGKSDEELSAFQWREQRTGVIVSWNTEGPENKGQKNCVVHEGGISINPINWKRDDTYATASG